MNVSIIIVNYNTKDLLINCIESIYKQTKDITFEIIISDNGSNDGSVEYIKQNFPNIILIENNKNLGFGAANNRGLKIAKGKYIFYLNSDTILLNNAIKFFYNYWETHDNQEHIGALGANLLNKNFETIHSYDNFPQLDNEIFTTIKVWLSITKHTIQKVLLNKKIPLCVNDDKEPKYIGDVDQIIGADLFLKNNELAYFDESFFMYLEETDLQYKIYKKKLKRMIIDGPQIIHLCGGSSTTNRTINKVSYFTTFSNIQYYISRIIYFKNRNANIFKIFILKLITLLIWINPLIIKHTKKYIKKLIKT